MEIRQLLDSRGCGIHFCLLLARTEPHAAYPGRLPGPRAGIFRRLEALDGQTRDRLDRLAASLRSEPAFESLGPPELYMLRQRMHCALDLLSRLADSEPSPGWLSTDGFDLEPQDAWLLGGVWREFGAFWLQNLAWRLSKGLPE